MADEPSGDAASRSSRLRVEVLPGAAAEPVLKRVVTLFASRAGLSVHRLSHLVAALDSLHTCASGLVARERLGVTVDIAPGRVELEVGPLRESAARDLLSGCRGAGIAGGADEARVLARHGGEAVLGLRFGQVAPGDPIGGAA